jgi:hypothetical protein
MKCPQCGKEMELGTLQINSDWVLHESHVKWFPKNEKIVHGIGDMVYRTYWRTMSGAKCQDCGLITLHWEDLARLK